MSSSVDKFYEMQEDCNCKVGKVYPSIVFKTDINEIPVDYESV